MGGRYYSTSYGGSVQVLHKTLVSQNCLQNEKIALKKASMDRNRVPKISLPEGNWALQYHCWMEEPNSCPVKFDTFWSISQKYLSKPIFALNP